MKLLRVEDAGRTRDDPPTVSMEVPDTHPDFAMYVARFDGWNNGYAWGYVDEVEDDHVPVNVPKPRERKPRPTTRPPTTFVPPDDEPYVPPGRLPPGTEVVEGHVVASGMTFHSGPGPHPSGSPQSSHGGKGGGSGGRLANTMANETVVSEERVGVNSLNMVYRREYSDGTVVAAKTLHPDEAVKEVVAARIANALDIPIEAEIEIDGTLLTTWIEGEHGKPEDVFSFGSIVDKDTPIPGITDSQDGIRIGILDIAINNQDRHGLNWIRSDDGRVLPIDHGLSFMSSGGGGFTESPFAADPILGGANSFRPGDWGKNQLSRADMDEVMARMDALKPEFEALGAEDLWTSARGRLQRLTARASGDRKVLD